MRARRFAVGCAAVLFAARWAAAAPAPAIQFHADGSPPAVEVSGLAPDALQALARGERTSAQWAALFAVFAEPPDLAAGTELPPMAGAWSVAEGKLRFTPQFPFAPGVNYRAVFRPARLPGADPAAPTLSASFASPARAPAVKTHVAALHPTDDVLPENLLKFYLEFSAPMSRGGIYDHVVIRDGDGRAVEMPFLELAEELWNPEMTRVTLIIDPGRIKRGVQPLEDIGPVFEEGKSYALVVSDRWRDAAGRPLSSPSTLRFRAGPADRTPPDPARWAVRAPPAGGPGALAVEFDEPLDHALAQRLLEVRTAAGAPVPGAVRLENRDRRWTFTPAQPWAAGDYQIVVPTIIEDLAGNNIGKPFDVDVFSGVQRSLESATVALPFTVK